MLKLTVMYPNNEDLKFDKEYYINKHSQLLKDLLGDALVSFDVNFGISGGNPGEPAPYFVIANLVFESMESFEKSFGAHSERIGKDLSNFSNVKPEIQLSEVV